MSLLRIGDLARLGGVSVRMLRHYHELGLLEPEHVDERTGYRSYDLHHLDVLRRIVALKDLGLALPQVGDIVHGRLDHNAVRAVLVDRRAAIGDEIAASEQRIAQLDRQLARLDANPSSQSGIDAGSSHDKDSSMTDSASPALPGPSIEVELKAVPARLVAQMSAIAESWAPTDIGPVIQPLYPELMARMERAGVAIAGPSTAWYEDTEDGRVKVHATLTIAERPPADPAALGFEVVELEALDRAASTIHRGTMDDCDSTYEELLAWIDEHGFRAVGYSRELDIECGPGKEWITELQLAIEPTS